MQTISKILMPMVFLLTSTTLSMAAASVTHKKLSLLSLKTASIQQLMHLPGIGQITAHRIIAYRQAHGGKISLDDLYHVRGISKRMVLVIKKSGVTLTA